MEEPAVSMEIQDDLEFKPSNLDPNKIGVWTKVPLAEGTKFGPYEGKRVTQITTDMDTNYVWEIVEEDTDDLLWYIDATDPSSSNWLRYINCARFFEEQNMISEQEGVAIYYRTIKDVEAGVELLTWFDKSGLAELQKKKIRGKKHKLTNSKDNTPTKRKKGSTSNVEEGEIVKSRKSVSPQKKRNSYIMDYDYMPGSKIKSPSSDIKNTTAMDDIDVEMKMNGKSSGPNRYPPPKEGEFQFDLLPHHVGVQASKKIYRCDICSGVYRHAFSLKRHYIRNHINYYYICEADRLNCCIKTEEVENFRQRMSEKDVNDSDKNNNSDSVEKEVVDKEQDSKEDQRDHSKIELDQIKCDKENIQDIHVKNDSSDKQDQTVDKTDQHEGEENSHVSPETENYAKDSTSQEKADPEGEQTEVSEHAEDKLEDIQEEDHKVVDTPKIEFDDVELETSSNENNKDEKEKELTVEEVSNTSTDGSTTSLPALISADTVTMDPEAAAGKMPGLYRCNLCNDLFDFVETLKSHLANHPNKTSAKSYSCNQCEMKFNQKQNLLRHSMVHTGAKPFECRFCNKHFPTITNRKRHEMIHLGKKFSCHVCDSSFSQSGDLKKHIRRVHPDNFHDCAFCPKYFSTDENLIEHLSTHNETVETNEHLKNAREECTHVDLNKDREESMKLAQQKTGFKFACTICKKRFHNYANMCRHRRLAHQRHLLGLGKPKPEEMYPEVNDATKEDETQDDEATFYANVARNIAENLTYHVDGKINGFRVTDNGIYQDENNIASERSLAWEMYNFPENVISKLKKENDYAVNGVKIKKEKPWSYGDTWYSYNVDKHHVQMKRKNGLPIKVPQFHKCNLCKCLFHNKFLYKEHMHYKHNQLDQPKSYSNVSSPLKDPAITQTPDYTDGSLTVSYRNTISDEPLDLSPKNRKRKPSIRDSPEHLHFSAIELKASLSKKRPFSTVYGRDDVPYFDPDQRKKDWSNASWFDRKYTSSPPRKFVCMVCLKEYCEEDALIAHQGEYHANVDCDHIEIDLQFRVPWQASPPGTGLLAMQNKHNRKDQTGEKLLPSSPIKCTKCQTCLPSLSDLHSHIVSCAGPEEKEDPASNLMPLKKGKRTKINIKKKKYYKIRVSEKTLPDSPPPEARTEEESLDGVSNGDWMKRKRRRNFELLYIPGRHVRRREMTELVDMHECKGCSAKFKTILLLERHIKKCSEKEKLKDVQVRQPLFVDGIYEQSVVPSKQHSCHYCHKQFVYRGSLRSHVYKCSVRKHRVHKGGHLNLNWESDLKKQARSEMEKLRNNNGNTKIVRLTGRRKKKRKNHRWTQVKRRKDETQAEGDYDDLAQMGDADDESEGSSEMDKLDLESNDSSDGMTSSQSSVSSLNISDTISEHPIEDHDNISDDYCDRSCPNMSKKDVVARLACTIKERQKKKVEITEKDDKLICENNVESKLSVAENGLSNGQETPPKNVCYNVRDSVQRKRRALSDEILQAELLDISDEEIDVPVVKSKRGRGKCVNRVSRKFSQGSTSSVSSENGVVENDNLGELVRVNVGRGQGRGRGKLSSLRINVVKDFSLESSASKSPRGRGRSTRGRGGRGRKKQIKE